MTSIKRSLMAAAGNAGGTLGYVEDVFSTYLYTGSGSTQTIANGIDLSGEGGMVWAKNRGSAVQHVIADTLRGDGKVLNPSSTAASGSWGAGSFFAAASNGFSVGGSDTSYNASATDYASWTFRKAEKFFDVVTYTGNGSTQNIAHNLGSVPGCIIIKKFNGTAGWAVYHRSIGNTEALFLNLIYGTGTWVGSEWWNNTTPTSTQFSVGGNDAVNNSGGVTYVAYLFASDARGFGDDGSESIIKCGSFTPSGGNAVIDVGFEPQWLLVKAAGTTSNWVLQDSMRGWPYSGSSRYLRPNLANAEDGLGQYSLRNNGFIASGQADYEYIYIAIRRPMKTPESGTEVFSPYDYQDATLTSGSGTASNRTILNGGVNGGTNFPVDLFMGVNRTGNHPYALHVFDRLRGKGKSLLTNATTAEPAGDGATNGGFDFQEGVDVEYNGQLYYYTTAAGNRTHIAYFLKRATGFMDVVAYSGTSSARTQAHGLTVIPELIITKTRSGGFTRGWAVYHASLYGSNQIVFLESNAGAVSDAIYQDGVFTATDYKVSIDANVNNSSNTYVAYLFATLAGVSKVGSYTGTGSDLNVDCGFSAGARFILIKRTDSTGDWYYWDSARGIVAGNDPYQLMNSNAAEVTNTDYVDPLNAGFTVTSSAPAGLNASGGTYIFLSIA
jgi:hypothetical protein